MRGDELRDRIAGVLDENFNPDKYPIMAEMFRDYAQAIIDDLGLVVEGTVRVVDYGAGPLRIPQTRVIGKWER